MDYLQHLIERYPHLAPLKDDINTVFEIIAQTFSDGGKLLIAGNGGSAADAEHIAGELMKTFVKKRKLPDAFVSDLQKVDSGIAQFLIPRLQPGLPVILFPLEFRGTF